MAYMARMQPHSHSERRRRTANANLLHVLDCFAALHQLVEQLFPTVCLLTQRLRDVRQLRYLHAQEHHVAHAVTGGWLRNRLGLRLGSFDQP